MYFITWALRSKFSFLNLFAVSFISFLVQGFDGSEDLGLARSTASVGLVSDFAFGKVQVKLEEIEDWEENVD